MIMKTFMRLALLLLMVNACSDDDDSNNTNSNGTNPPEPTPQEEYLENIVGLWDLTDVRYSLTIPPPQQGLPPIPISGQGKNVSGLFNMEQNPQEITYNLSFFAGVPNPLTGDSIDIPINFGNSGTYAVNENATEITVSNNDGTTTTLEILLDRENRQTFRTVQPFAIPMFDTVDVTTELTIKR